MESFYHLLNLISDLLIAHLSHSKLSVVIIKLFIRILMSDSRRILPIKKVFKFCYSDGFQIPQYIVWFEESFI